MFTRIAALNVAAERMVADLRRRTFRSVIRQEMGGCAPRNYALALLTIPR